MNEGVSLGEIEVVQRHVFEALVASSARTTLSKDQQDAMLAQACLEACHILDRWVSSPVWEEVRPAGRGPIADVIPDWQLVRPFLEPLSAALTRIGERQPAVSGMPEVGDPEAYIDEIIKRAESTGRRHRKFGREELYAEATHRIRVLQSSVCAAASDFAKESKKGSKTRARLRSAARTVLKQVGGFLFGAALIMVGVTQPALAHNAPVWAHEAVNVVLVHQAAHAAQPSVRVAPPQLGPRLG
jgi:hypothetical protein